MALLELSVRIFSSLLDVIFIGVRMACRIGYRTTSTLMCIAVMELCHSTGVPISVCRVNLMALTC